MVNKNVESTSCPLKPEKMVNDVTSSQLDIENFVITENRGTNSESEHLQPALAVTIVLPLMVKKGSAKRVSKTLGELVSLSIIYLPIIIEDLCSRL